MSMELGVSLTDQISAFLHAAGNPYRKATPGQLARQHLGAAELLPLAVTLADSLAA